MKRHTVKGVGITLFAFMLIMAFTACESPTAVEDDSFSNVASLEIDELADVLVQELSLSPSQQSDVQSSLRRHQGRLNDPGFLWYVAADMQETLTDEQKEELYALAARIQAQGGLGQRPGSGVRGGFDSGIGPEGPGEGPGGLGLPNGGQQPGESGFISRFEDLLTDEQIDQIETIQEVYREQFEALHQSRIDETLTHEEFREQMDTLREAMRAEIEALLTDEQIAAIEAQREAHRADMEARREAQQAANQERAEQVRAAMADALGLTDDQLNAIEALHDQLLADRETLHEQLINGDLTREAFHIALDELRTTEMEQMESILDDVQMEIVRIHNALHITRAARQARNNRPNAGTGERRRPRNGGQGNGGPGQGPGNGGSGPGSS